MKSKLVKIIRQSPFAEKFSTWETKRVQTRELREWEKNGKPMPPPHLIKQKTLIDYSAKYNLKILVETGTYLGDMVEATRHYFDTVYSIELSRHLFEMARTRFIKAKNVKIMHGDSGVEIKNIMDILDQPALFWLDGHYSAGITARGEKDTPIFEELDHILHDPDKGHVIIIDDARCFIKGTAYPSIEELSDFVVARKSKVQITVENDSIKILPELYY